ncbi:cation diffusion facilitator family transporter [Acidimicrobiaceae bacterium]|jgi:cation diffusion facilitator family transporter|nr:cation diffusion facilitator family transporter [Acidimicrobiaceae bacterium]MDA9737578.1 cation diffusion facilitator family transporter [Acidimicrobiaceae bacterium]|tara:strand:- start:11 stop:916 length:906 start_codon:yes stop_codon:yes gene_type:complete
MASNGSSKTVFLAFSVNFFIAGVKTVIAVITSSSAMFSEAVHSYVDSGNQFILWFGIKQSKKPNKLIYPLGRGKEEYFWTLVVAVLIFTIGGLVSLEHGIEALSHPKELKNLFISIVVLSMSIVLELYVLYKAVKELRSKSKTDTTSVFKLLKESTDGPLIAIVVEDFAATLGLGIALVGSILANVTSNPVYDAASSILIGILLMVSGLFLGYEMKHLITGETVNTKTKDKIYNTIEQNDMIKNIESLKIISIGANKYLVLCTLDYLDTAQDSDVVNVNSELKNKIFGDFEEITEIYFNPA